MKELMQKQKAWRESLLVPKSRVVPGSEVGPGTEPVMPPEATETGAVARAARPWSRVWTSGPAHARGPDDPERVRR